MTYKIKITDPDGEVILSKEMGKDEVELHATTKTQRIKRIAAKLGQPEADR